MRHVVCLSDIPPHLHDWLKAKAARETEQTGKRVAVYQIAVEAIQRYKDLNSSSRKARVLAALHLLTQNQNSTSNHTRSGGVTHAY